MNDQQDDADSGDEDDQLGDDMERASSSPSITDGGFSNSPWPHRSSSLSYRRSSANSAFSDGVVVSSSSLLHSTFSGSPASESTSMPFEAAASQNCSPVAHSAMGRIIGPHDYVCDSSSLSVSPAVLWPSSSFAHQHHHHRKEESVALRVNSSHQFSEPDDHSA